MVVSHFLEASSAPKNIFRNCERYHLEHYNTKSCADLNTTRANAWNQTLYAKDRLLEHGIPSYLLHDHIVQSHLLSQTQSYPNERDVCLPCYRYSTVTALHHGNKSLIVHTAGKEMDVLVLRDVEHIKQQFGSASIADPCFSLPLNCGVPIIEIAAAGSPSFESCSHLLARTSSELFYMRTVNITDHIPTSHNNHKSNPILSATPEVEMLLEPLQKWQCPVELISMTTSPSEWSYASFLSTSGTLFMWNPLDGLRKFSSDPLIDPNLMAGYSHGAYDNIKDLNLSTALLDFTLHPQILHVALGVALYRTDLRCRLLQKDLIYTTSNSRTRNDICSLKQHGDIGHLFVLNTLDGEVLLMDSRYTKTCVAERVIPEPHSNMKFYNSSTGTTNDKHGLFVGSSSCSRQILMHDVDLTNQNGNRCNSQNDGNTLIKSVKNDKERINGLTSKFLSAGRSFGMRNGDLQWDVSGYPVISRSGSESLWGFDFIPFQKQDKEDETVVSKDQSHQMCNAMVLDKNFSGILVQQSSLGDVYAQLITHTDAHKISNYCGQDQNPKKKRAGMLHTTTQLGAPCGVSFDIEIYDTINRMQNESSAIPKILPEAISGHILPEIKMRAGNTKENTIICNYPLASQAFYPFLDETSMKCMDEVIIEPECFRRDCRVQKNEYLRIDLPPDKTPMRLGNDLSELLSLFKDGMHKVFKDHMQTHGPLTLAEIWTYLNLKTLDKFHTNLNSLREFLDQQEGIFGYICPCPKGVLDIGSLRRGKGTFDGYCVSSSTGSINEVKISDDFYDSGDKSKNQTRDIEDEEISSLPPASSSSSVPPSSYSSSSSANSYSSNQQESTISPSKLYLKCHCYKLISNNQNGKQTGGTHKNTSNDSKKSVGKGIEDINNQSDGKKYKEKENEVLEAVEFPCRSLSCIIPHILMYSNRENNIFKALETKVDSDNDTDLSQKRRSISNSPIRGGVSDVTPLIIERLESVWMT
jgi:hypothetical protein